jgi:hypothetical protein
MKCSLRTGLGVGRSWAGSAIEWGVGHEAFQDYRESWLAVMELERLHERQDNSNH